MSKPLKSHINKFIIYFKFVIMRIQTIFNPYVTYLIPPAFRNTYISLFNNILQRIFNNVDFPHLDLPIKEITILF